MIQSEKLKELVDEQLIVGLACLTPRGNIHGTPVWIATNGKELFFYSREERKKINNLKNNPICTIIFNYGSVDGVTEIITKHDERFMRYYTFLDPRYKHNTNYETYKKNWDVLVLINPKKIY
jgi:general stress protein 26